MKKTLSFTLMHFTIAFLLAYALTGSLLTGSLIALLEPLVNSVAFYFHDKFWQGRERAALIAKLAH